MLYLKKLIKSMGVSIIILLLVTFLITLLNYINIILLFIFNYLAFDQGFNIE